MVSLKDIKSCLKHLSEWPKSAYIKYSPITDCPVGEECDYPGCRIIRDWVLIYRHD